MLFDSIYYNGKIFTSLPDREFVSAMAVTDGRIVWTGDDPDISKAVKAVDLEGKTILPGFIDCHMHAINLAGCSRQIAVLPPYIYSLAQLKEKLIEERKRLGGETEGKWLIGWGYDEGKLAEKRPPNRYDLDDAVSDIPICVTRVCGHIAAVNSKALELAGIDRNTPDPSGGRIGRDENGEPDGMLYETATRLAETIAPHPSLEEMADNLVFLDKKLLSDGLTCISDMGEYLEADEKDVYALAAEKGMKTKATFYYEWDLVKEGRSCDMSPEAMDQNRQHRAGGLKLIGDGSVSGKTAWYYEKYKDSCETGMPVCTEEDIRNAAAYAKEHKCQVSIHAMGTAAIDRAVNILSLEENWMDGGVPSARIEHVTNPGKTAVEKAVRSGIFFATQPVFMFSEIESYLKNLGIERTKTTYAIADWLAAGVHVALSTDSPATSWAEPWKPFINIKACVTRKAWDGTDCGIEQSIDVKTAVRLYTANAARCLGLTNTGCLAPGMWADFIVLDKDIFSMPPEELDRTLVLETYINGERVFSR